MALSAAQIQAEATRLAGRGLYAAGIYLNARVKENLSIAAPRVIVRSGAGSRRPGATYYRATTPATKGAPPRKLSGALRASYRVVRSSDGFTVRVGSSMVYARPLETWMDHPVLIPTLRAELSRLAQIVGAEVA